MNSNTKWKGLEDFARYEEDSYPPFLRERVHGCTNKEYHMLSESEITSVMEPTLHVSFKNLILPLASQKPRFLVCSRLACERSQVKLEMMVVTPGLWGEIKHKTGQRKCSFEEPGLSSDNKW
ncbi:hypothetical protein AB6A40_010605 [Gnathostoma spinigerum]|uniref:Uncharacterized protein n=1 Tax=Gnathostoma spinigerum TaxID=75299 RepID=A0ABD6EX21_9BILA